MGQLNIRSLEAGFGKTGNVSDRKNTKEMSDDFKKLLKDNPKPEEELNSKPEKEVPEKQVEEKPSEDAKTEEMISGMQMGQLLLGIQNFQERQKDVVNVEAEQNTEAGVTGVVLEEPVMQEIAAEEIAPEQAASPVMAEGQNQGKAEGAHLQAAEDENTQIEVKPAETEVKKTEKQKTRSDEKPEAAEKKEVPQENPVPQMAAHNVKDVAPAHETHQVHTQRMHVSQPEEIPQKLPGEILTQISNGVREFEIQIAPEHLGKIAIKVLFEHEQTIISIACSEKNTLDIMGRHAREIGAIMERNLGDSTEVFVERQEQDYQNQYGDENDHSGRESEEDRQRQESKKQKTNDGGQFLQKLRLGLVE